MNPREKYLEYLNAYRFAEFNRVQLGVDEELQTVIDAICSFTTDTLKTWTSWHSGERVKYFVERCKDRLAS